MDEDKDNILIWALKGCSSRASVEETLTLYKVKDKAERIDRLNDCMGNPQTFFSSDINTDDKYELTIQMFLSGSWKLSEIYDRLGV